MGKVFDKLASTITYSASATKSDKLPADRRITEIIVRADVQHDNGAVVTPNADALLRMLGSLKVSGNGRTFYDVTDLRLLHYHNLLTRGGRRTKRDAFTTTVSTNGLIDRLTLHLHPGGDWGNPYDESAVIPGEDRPQHDIAIAWPANTQGGTGVTTATAAAIAVGSYGVQGRPRKGQPGSQVLVPVMTEQDFAIDATYSNLQKQFDLPTGGFLRSVLIMVTDNTASPNDALDDTRVTEVAIVLAKAGFAKPLYSDWRTLVAASKNYDVALANSHTAGGSIAGIALIDFRQIADQVLAGLGTPNGLDMRSLSVGDVKLAFTIGTGNGNIKLLYDRLEVAE